MTPTKTSPPPPPPTHTHTHIHNVESLKGTKNALFFHLRAPTYHSFIFNFRFLYELKDKFCLSKTV